MKKFIKITMAVWLIIALPLIMFGLLPDKQHHIVSYYLLRHFSIDALMGYLFLCCAPGVIVIGYYYTCYVEALKHIEKHNEKLRNQRYV